MEDCSLSTYLEDSQEEQEFFLFTSSGETYKAGREIGKASVMYIINDVVEALSQRDEKRKFSPTIDEIDPPKRYDPELPYDEVPESLRCGQVIRLYEPRNMEEFDRQHELEVSDSDSKRPYSDEMSRARLRDLFPIAEGVLSQAQYEKFIDMLYKYRASFSRSDSNVAIGTAGELRTPTIPNAVPQAAKPIRFAQHEQKIVDQKISELIKYKVLKLSSASWSSPVHLVFTPGSTKARLVCDYRIRLNQYKII